MFAHGFTFGGHPVAAAVALANLDIFEREDLCGHVLRQRGASSAQRLEGLRDLPIVGDVRGAGYFHAIELVKDRETKESFDDEESERPAARLPVRRALPQRPDLPRGRPRRPGVQLSPPLIAGQRAVRRDRGDPARRAERGRGTGSRRADAECDAMLTVQGLLDELGLAPLAGQERRPTRRSAGSTSASCSTRRRGCRAASCC